MGPENPFERYSPHHVVVTRLLFPPDRSRMLIFFTYEGESYLLVSVAESGVTEQAGLLYIDLPQVGMIATVKGSVTESLGVQARFLTREGNVGPVNALAFTAGFQQIHLLESLGGIYITLREVLVSQMRSIKLDGELAISLEVDIALDLMVL